MIQDLLIHTGDPKTGTSSIQSVLNAGAWRCSTSRLVPQRHLNNAPLANALKADADPAFVQAQFGELRDWFASRGGGTGVISTEFLARRDPHRLRGVLRDYFPGLPVRTISYVRPHASRAVSAYGQRLKTGTFDGSLPEFCRFISSVPTLYYAKRFPAWRQVFGSGMILRPFVRSELREGDAVSDFLYHALGTGDFELLPLDTVNEALSVAELSGLRLVQRVLRGQEVADHHRLALGGALQRKLSAAPGRSGEKPVLDQASASHLLTAFRTDAQALDSQFFGKPVLEEELLRSHGNAPPTQQDFSPESHFSLRQRTCLDKAATRIAALIQKMPKAWRQEYQVSVSQRDAKDIEDHSPAQRRNAKAVWESLDAITAVLAQPTTA
ncbi:hypothetical protein K3722_21425 (plasmid) [Leisingera caerulea]|uniref:Sulfotransferase family protein n=1 Tax=Leisingera caerulea TaxID=506591 RepID=A0ABY5X397_LEICA|nr:hypothetical protein [Leisingera caerulea]UWQ61066.1 hypothetical protein K3722_21425 [Leisingera caerulea]UWQ64747.1 hypothetical protein K3723_18945 [Leisingera caerulea]